MGYSALIGSFERKTNQPIEAKYIFSTYNDLVNFFNSNLEWKSNLHKGLLKVVENDGNGNQVLYWVYPTDISDPNSELIFKPLISSHNIDDIYDQLQKEIADRIAADDELRGDLNFDNFPIDLTNLLEIAKALEIAQGNIIQLDAELKEVVGTTEDDIIAYLQTLPLDYNNLTKISNKLKWFFDEKDPLHVSIDTWNELLDFLSGYKDTDKLSKIVEDIYTTMEEYYLKVLGTPIPSEPFRTLRGIEDWIRPKITSINTKIEDILLEINTTQSGVGLDSDGKYSPDQETKYLKTATSVMNALKTLDSLIEQALNRIITLTVKNEDIIPLTVIKNGDATEISAKLLISSVNGNGLLKKSDGLYFKVSSTFVNGVLTLLVNDVPVGTHDLNISTIIEDAYYNPPTEEIILVIKLMDGSTQTVRIPVTNLISEWIVDNNGPSKVVELTKEDVGNGPDKLSADVRLYVDKYNILKKEGNTLYVKGTSDNIVHNDLKVSIILDELITFKDSINIEVSNKLDKTPEDNKLYGFRNNIPEEITPQLIAKTKTIDNYDPIDGIVITNLISVQLVIWNSMILNDTDYTITIDGNGTGKIIIINPAISISSTDKIKTLYYSN